MFKHYSEAALALKNAIEILVNINQDPGPASEVIQGACEKIINAHKTTAQQIFLEEIYPHLQEGGAYVTNERLKPYIAFLVILLN